MESAEVVLASNPDAGSGHVPTTIADKSIFACTFAPDWAAVAPGQTPTAWRITQVTLNLAKDTTVGQGSTPWDLIVCKCDAAGKPTWSNTSPLNVIDKVQIPLASLQGGAAGQWPPPITITIPTPHDIAPTQRVAVFANPAPSSPKGYMGLQSGGTQQPADMKLYQSGTLGATWTEVTTGNRDAVVEVKGTYTY